MCIGGDGGVLANLAELVETNANRKALTVCVCPYMCSYLSPYMCSYMCPCMCSYMCSYLSPYMCPYMCPYLCPCMFPYMCVGQPS